MQATESFASGFARGPIGVPEMLDGLAACGGAGKRGNMGGRCAIDRRWSARAGYPRGRAMVGAGGLSA